MKRFKFIVVIMLFIFAVGCGEKEPPTMGIGYCYLYGDGVKVIYPDGSMYYVNTDYQDDFDYDNGYLYFTDEKNVFKANISSNQITPIVNESDYKKVKDNLKGARPIVSLDGLGKVALQFYTAERENSSIYIIENGVMEYLCEVDGDGINHNSSTNMNRVAFCADKDGENLFIKQNDQLVKFNIQSKTGSTLISDFKYDIFDVDGSGDKVAYIYGDCIYLYEISSGKETLVEEMEFPVGKICLSDDGNWIMVLDVTEPKGFLADIYPPSPIYNLYIYDCVNKQMNKVVEDGGGTIFGSFCFAE